MSQSKGAPPDGGPTGAASFDDETTIAIKSAFHEDEPTEPFSTFEGDVGDIVSTTDGIPLPTAAIVQRVMGEVERLRGLAGARGARLTEAIRKAIQVGLSLPGQQRLSPDHAVAAASGLLALADDQYKRAASLFERAGLDEGGQPVEGADVDAERALLLRALAERRSTLETGVLARVIRMLGFQVTSDRKLAELAAFAEEIRGRGAR